MLLSGCQLRRIFDYFCPFDQEGNLLPEEERVTILASNMNLPVELQARAFAMAAGAGKKSPMIVQLSYNAARMLGSDVHSLPPLAGVEVSQKESPLVAGAKQAVALLEQYVQTYGAEYVALSLDHFQVPQYDEASLLGKKTSGRKLERSLAEARVLHAANYMQDVFGEESVLTETELQSYVEYLLSPQYVQFRHDFLAVVQAVSPAWGMIDTEKLPPILDFVVTREIVDDVRSLLGNHDMIIEAEFGATGQSGQAIPYEPLTGPELQHFAQKVVCFIQYTGADAIAYPIGMEHAARKDVRHEPDRERLQVVQGELFRACGRYIPFAQHGGTGAASLARGLVGKNNVNTHYLVAGANALADWVEANGSQIRVGEKKYSGTNMFIHMLQAEAEAALAKLEETGSLHTGDKLQDII